MRRICASTSAGSTAALSVYPRSFPGSHPEGLIGVLRAARGRGPG